MNYGETLTYWYLRLNGFFLLRNFVLHPPYESEGTNNQAADSDLLAVRFPHVYEDIGGQPDDWDSRFRTWGFYLEEDVIGLIIEVKTSPNANRSEIRENSFNRSRIKQAVQRMGMFKLEDTEDIVDELWSTAVTTKRGPYRLGKLLFSQRPVRGVWLNIKLQEAEQFSTDRLQKYSELKR